MSERVIYTNPIGLAIRLRSVAETECEYDEWLADLLTQSAQVIEEGREEISRLTKRVNELENTR